MFYSRKKITLIAIAATLVGIASFFIWRLTPVSAKSMLRSAVIIEETSWQEVTVDGKPCLYFASAEGDSILIGVTTLRDSAIHRNYSTGFWHSRSWAYPSCRGRIATVTPPLRRTLRNAADTLVLRLCAEAVERELKVLEHQKDELAYYMRSHGVQDNGYQQIAILNNKVSREYAGAKRAQERLNALRNSKHKVAVAWRSTYVAVFRDEDERLTRLPLRPISNDTNLQGITALQTMDAATPSGVTPLYIRPFAARHKRDIIAIGFPSIGEPGLECDTVSPQMVPGRELASGCHDIPPLLAGNGAPVFTKKGLFVGFLNGKKIYQ